MVLKKPYAFLIKYFKILHLILAGLMIYLSIRINLITTLFSKIVDNVSIVIDGLSKQYITLFMYVILIIIIFIAFIIWFLMKNKQKPTKFYLGIIGYYLILFVFLIVYSSTLKSLEEVSMTNNALRIYNDIAFLLPLFQYYFIVMSLLRGIGFNIKQFNFSKDIKELEISEEDSEEIEVSLSNNTYKFSRSIRKYLRELKYYFFENKYWILIILGIIFIVGIIYFFVNYKFVNNNFSQKNSVKVGQYNVFINNVYVTDRDLYGEIINKDKKYVIIDTRIRNIYYDSIELDIKKFMLHVGRNYYYPITNKDVFFKDLGLPYDYKFLESNKDYSYILIYEIDKSESIRNMSLKIYKSLNYEKNKAEFVNINLKSIKLSDNREIKNINLNDNIIIDENKFKNSSFVLKNYKIMNKFEYTYDVCLKKECNKKTGVIMPSNVLNNKLIGLEYELLVDKNSLLYNFVKNDKDFFNTFITLTYTFNGMKKNVKLVSITNDNINNQIFLEVSSEVENAEEIEMIVNTRNNKYIYKLK